MEQDVVIHPGRCRFAARLNSDVRLLFDMAGRSRQLVLAAWLLSCPIFLLAAVLWLPRLNLYGTPAERYTLFALLILPLISAVGSARHFQSTRPARLLLATGYLVAGLVLASFSVIFIGCSSAGACF